MFCATIKPHGDNSLDGGMGMKGILEGREQLIISELEALRQRVAELEKLELKRTRLEKALRTSEERYRSLVNNVQLGILRSTPGPPGKILEVNPAFEEITGYSRDELLAMYVEELYAHCEERRALMEALISAGDTVTRELQWRKKDGSEIVVLDTVITVRDEAGKVLHFDAIIEDITERKQMEQQLVITDRLASVGEVASGIAHELNNPLTSVIGFSQLLLDKDIPEDIKEDVRIVASEAQRAAVVVKNLLTFARKHAQVKELVNRSDIIGKVLELRAYEQRVNNIQVKTRFAADLPRVMADFFQLQQVFLNIVINAEHFMVEAHNKGTLTITTEKVDNVVKASFADDGPGIPEEDLGHVFDPFFTTKEVGKGTGLGLSICHGIITEHGGQIYARSELGKGATFTVELPIQ
jgi:PAS domain S-box-containing protein